ncbi:MAG: hypothetical protein EOS25_01815 [Mesorhizobium sp.]|uniref:hypothetical protein n=1 Tax=Mesorhizobium sp. TaxID=1871066 RepID=UPI000FE866C6|nr:hypothetical protein [Mesorhizobium sp.]RWD52295.1 MAG: hypothetical protein EOS59_03610 [Mesorhizobium sp.]RWE61934.1 MAG: hypothetical protein EOS24_09435 [Mesorhizobium sp.]RWF12100.1 MAG: hypothetical protein EOS69_05665 [Mesorhizobium sp.]RWF22391.1 MAG: hypothetical protein EOS25_01815 [Mesorhizobium sp.]TIY04137.1 MAG: hypothetical protein E5V22_12315 [Mesorhizobium sp.]
MQEWTTDALWAKAIALAEETFKANPNDASFPLNAAFTLEVLGKAALAKIHPVLIADPQSEGGKNILYAFGVPTARPTTIVAKTIFSRLTLLVDGFTDDDEAACKLIIDARNRHLHSGAFPYADYKTGQWLPDFYRVCKILTDFLARDLSELLGKEHAKDAEESAAGERKRIEGETQKQLAVCRKKLKALQEAGELEARRAETKPERAWRYLRDGTSLKSTLCPVCDSEGLLTLKHVTDRPAEISDNLIYVDSIYSPRKFECAVCDLALTGTAELAVVGLADQVIGTSESDPTEYFDIDVHAYDAPDYGND